MEFCLHVIVVIVVEHMLDVFERFLVTLVSSLTHDVCYLGYRIFKFWAVLNCGGSIVKTKDDTSESQVSNHQREPSYS